MTMHWGSFKHHLISELSVEDISSSDISSEFFLDNWLSSFSQNNRLFHSLCDDWSLSDFSHNRCSGLLNNILFVEFMNNRNVFLMNDFLLRFMNDWNMSLLNPFFMNYWLNVLV